MFALNVSDKRRSLSLSASLSPFPLSLFLFFTSYLPSNAIIIVVQLIPSFVCLFIRLFSHTVSLCVYPPPKQYGDSAKSITAFDRLKSMPLINNAILLLLFRVSSIIIIFRKCGTSWRRWRAVTGGDGRWRHSDRNDDDANKTQYRQAAIKYLIMYIWNLSDSGAIRSNTMRVRCARVHVSALEINHISQQYIFFDNSYIIINFVIAWALIVISCTLRPITTSHNITFYVYSECLNIRSLLSSSLCGGVNWPVSTRFHRKSHSFKMLWFRNSICVPNCVPNIIVLYTLLLHGQYTSIIGIAARRPSILPTNGTDQERQRPQRKAKNHRCVQKKEFTFLVAQSPVISSIPSCARARTHPIIRVYVPVRV